MLKRAALAGLWIASTAVPSHSVIGGAVVISALAISVDSLPVIIKLPVTPPSPTPVAVPATQLTISPTGCPVKRDDAFWTTMWRRVPVIICTPGPPPNGTMAHNVPQS
jgi:hypothetical protein